MENKMKTSTAAFFAFILVLLIAIYSVITGVLGITGAWAGYIFIFYWSAVHQFDVESLKTDIPCSIVGIAIGFGLFMAQSTVPAGLYSVIVLCTLFVIIMLSMTNIVPYLIGNATFLFSTILTSGLIPADANYLHIFLGYIIGAIFFIVTIGIFFKIVNRKSEQ